MKPKLTASIGTIKQVTDHILLSATFLWCSPLRSFSQLLHSFKGLTVDNRLVYTLEYYPIPLRIVESGFVLERLGVGLEVDDVAAIFLLCEDFRNRCFCPLVRIGLRSLSASSKSFGLSIRHGYHHFVLLQNSCDGFVSLTLKTHTEYISHYLCCFRINYPPFLVVRGFQITIRRLRKRFAGVAAYSV